MDAPTGKLTLGGTVTALLLEESVTVTAAEGILFRVIKQLLLLFAFTVCGLHTKEVTATGLTTGLSRVSVTVFEAPLYVAVTTATVLAPTLDAVAMKFAEVPFAAT